MVVAVSFFQPQNKSTTPRTFKNTQEVIDFLLREAVKDAETQSHVHLDYSVESIRRVESIFGELHAQYASNPSSIAVKGLASAYGAYIGEVIRRTETDVNWETSDSVGGHAYPMGWCYHRIVEGDSDNVWVKYQALKERASHPSPTPKK
jgi:hypothetical protein